FNSAVDQSDDTFTVPPHAPKAFISAPEDKRFYVGEQTVILEGAAIDIEDESLAESHLAWSSNLNGPLGTGRSLAIDASILQEGVHPITLRATDSAGQTGSASITIQIFRTRPALPATLSANPSRLTFLANLGTGETAAQTIAIRNSGDGDSSWSATTNQSWIHLSATSGSLPSNLEVRADATGL